MRTENIFVMTLLKMSLKPVLDTSRVSAGHETEVFLTQLRNQVFGRLVGQSLRKLKPFTVAELKDLLGDNLVREDKISGAKFYWSFPGEQRTKKEADINQTQAATAQLARRVEELTAQAEEARKATGQSEADASRIREAEEAIAAFKQREADAKAEKERLLKSSGQNMALRKKDLPVLKDAANRWTDNLFELRKYLCNKFGMDESEMDKRLGTNKIDFVE